MKNKLSKLKDVDFRLLGGGWTATLGELQWITGARRPHLARLGNATVIWKQSDAHITTSIFLLALLHIRPEC
jgi:hypothetical protein